MSVLGQVKYNYQLRLECTWTSQVQVQLRILWHKYLFSGCVSDHDPADHDPDHGQDHDLAELSRDPDPDLILSGRLSRDPDPDLILSGRLSRDPDLEP